jgi:hypothetical protein
VARSVWRGDAGKAGHAARRHPTRLTNLPEKLISSYNIALPYIYARIWLLPILGGRAVGEPRPPD